MSSRYHTIKKLLCVLFITSLAYVPVCAAEVTGEFLVFPQLDLTYRPDVHGSSMPEEDEHEIGVVLFQTFEVGNFRFLGEYIISDLEQEFERLQLGWLIKDQLFWLGRFHNPIGYWNAQYHHGAYLQPSISRPSTLVFEERGGILPTHQAGLLVEGTIESREHEWGYALALGTGPEFTTELEAWDLLDSDSRSGELSATINLHRDFGVEANGRIGFFANHTEIPANAIDLREIQQVSAGIYGSLEQAPWRWHGSTLYVHNQLERPSGSPSDSFFNAYLQVEYERKSTVSFYSRIELTVNDSDDEYLALFPLFVRDRLLGGIRYDLGNHSAFKLEFSSNRINKADFAEVSFQWSALF
jgi:hypothetical protein